MKPFKFRFAKIEDWKETVRDEKRSLLAEAVRLEMDLLDQISAAEGEVGHCLNQYREICSSGDVDIDNMLNWRRHEHQLRVGVKQLQQQLVLVQRELERRRETLKAADQEVKVFQKLHERDFEKDRIIQKRREQALLDEFAQRKV